jgi:hypothetical protein
LQVFLYLWARAETFLPPLTDLTNATLLRECANGQRLVYVMNGASGVIPDAPLRFFNKLLYGVTEFLARGVPLMAPPPELVPFLVTPLLLAQLAALSPLPPALILSIV